ncbi:MAG: amidase [Gammaproteobacteria bacterium]|nr:amidase [Gammaproteobacteria bacterium]MBU0787157.1 amidase [Gammaproteobacteria bacterium]MBU0814164.1 amidase [Gammaproteobacteria bacterium]MBU1786316.1 amidase [Gammaproteobacteria bacterium]
MQADLLSTRQGLLTGQTSPVAEMERCIAVAESPLCKNVFLKTQFDAARHVAVAADVRQKPLAGLAISVKDLFDIQGQVTTAGSLALADRPPAVQDCTAVARLKAAGAAVIGRTNMTEFAFSGVGVNPHFDTPANAAATDVPRIPGGSSSGAAVSVASGAAFIGLGSDTGGSIRIPAALQGIVGFKSTARLVPTEGAIPLSTTMDTVCALTRSVRDAMLSHEILAQCTLSRSDAPLSSYRLAVANTMMHDGLDATVTRAYQRTLEKLRQAGAKIEEIPLSEIAELGAIQSTGGFSAAESYAWHRKLIELRADQYDPRVLARIQRGATMRAYEYLDLQVARRDWIMRIEQRLAGFDAVLSPTVPTVAAPIAEVAPGPERDEAFFAVNAQMLRNTSMVNMLDGCAISIPCQCPDELPVGLMVWHAAMHDNQVLNIAWQIEKLLQNP